MWFLRHGKPSFDYETRSYDTFMEMLCNGFNTPLLKEHGINFKKLPEWVEFVAYSPAKRAAGSAKGVRKTLGVKTMEEWDLLREVKFDGDIISRQEYTSPSGAPMLTSWLGAVPPFTLKSGDQFRTKAPPPLSSRRYAKDYNEVKALGARFNSARTPEQDQLAYFFAGNNFILWNRVLREIAAEHTETIGDRARSESFRGIPVVILAMFSGG